MIYLLEHRNEELRIYSKRANVKYLSWMRVRLKKDIIEPVHNRKTAFYEDKKIEKI
jgi:hypothetical protein